MMLVIFLLDTTAILCSYKFSILLAISCKHFGRDIFIQMLIPFCGRKIHACFRLHFQQQKTQVFSLTKIQVHSKRLRWTFHSLQKAAKALMRVYEGFVHNIKPIIITILAFEEVFLLKESLTTMKMN